MDSHELIVIDGITMNLVGELLLDSEMTVRMRSSSPITYLRCLEDFTFAALFSGNIAVSRNLHGLGKQNPGSELVQQFEKEKVKLIEDTYASEPAELLLPGHGREYVLELVHALAELNRPETKFWIDYMRREAEAYLTPTIDCAHKIQEDIQNPSEYVFGKPYWIDREIQDKIDSNLIDQLATIVRDLYPDVSLTATKEFVRRSILAHVLIFEWYSRAVLESSDPGRGRFLLPYATRTTLVKTGEYDLGRQVWRMHRLLMPRLLGEILRRSSDRIDVIKWLQEYVSDIRIDPLRSRVREALETFDFRLLQSVADEIEAFIGGIDDRNNTEIATRFSIGTKGFDIGWERKTKKHPTQYQRALMLLLTRTHDDRGEMFRLASRIFPELQ